MRRRRPDGPKLDFVDALLVSRSARMAGNEAMGPDARLSWESHLEGLAVQFGFGTVEEMVAEAEMVRAERLRLVRRED